MEDLIPIIVPPIDDDRIPRKVSIWFSDVGDEIQAGDFIIELLVPGITTTIPAPSDGILECIDVPVGRLVHTGDVVGWILPRDS